jgi:HEAT repeat protein
MSLKCETVKQNLSLFLYGELSFEEEERMQAHLAGCANCQAELARAERLHRAIDTIEEPLPADLLVGARRNLRLTIASEASRRADASIWSRLMPPFGGGTWTWKPAAGLALIALSFLGGRFSSLPNSLPAVAGFGASSPVATRVAYIEPAAQGRGVQIVLDETHRRVVEGDLGDESIKRLLLAAAKDPNDPGLRVESVEMLCSRSGEAEIRSALLYALEHDSNPGVRSKAIEGLKTFAKDPQTRQVLARVLLKDASPVVRAQAIDVLTQVRDKDMVAPLQELLRKEDNDYVRLRTQSVLREMKASPGIF